MIDDYSVFKFLRRGVDRRHLMQFKSANTVSKFLQCYVDRVWIKPFISTTTITFLSALISYSLSLCFSFNLKSATSFLWRSFILCCCSFAFFLMTSFSMAKIHLLCSLVTYLFLRRVRKTPPLVRLSKTNWNNPMSQ